MLPSWIGLELRRSILHESTHKEDELAHLVIPVHLGLRRLGGVSVLVEAEDTRITHQGCP